MDLGLELCGRDAAPSMRAIMALDIPSQAIDYTSYRCREVTPP